MKTSIATKSLSLNPAQDKDPSPPQAAKSTLKVVRLIMVTDRNNNKFYEMKEQSDGTFEVVFGRVGTSGSRKNYPMAQWDRKLNEKLRKGYQDMTHLFAIPQKTWKWEDITDPCIKSLMDRLLRYSKASLSRNYRVNATEVSLKQVEAAQDLVDALVSGCENDGDITQMNEWLLQLYAVIPRRMGDVRENLFQEDEATGGREAWRAQLAEEQATLDVMRGQVELQALKKGKEKPESKMLEAMGLEISLVDDEKALRLIRKKMGPDSHRFVRAYEVRHQASHTTFNTFVAGQKSRKKELLWHGSRNENWFSILSSGLVLRPANAIITGKMFGYGIYFADKCRKSLNYSSLSGAYWTGGNQSEGFLALYEVHVGKQLKIRKHQPWCYDLTEKELKARGKYDSLFAKGGVDLMNNEYIVYRADQCTVKYLIEVKN